MKYLQTLQQAQIVSSMRRKWNYWDNAPVESFFASLKKELIYPYKHYKTRAQVQGAVFR